MRITFSKYHGLGNDFIMVDNMAGRVTMTAEARRQLSERRYGVGGDGVILLGVSTDHSFVVHYYNADGNIGSLCGNGSRCALAFARQLGLIDKEEVIFKAYDGVHKGRYLPDEDLYSIGLKDMPLCEIEKIDEMNYFLDNGSPHHVKFVEGLSTYDVVGEGRKLRHGRYGSTGANINFVEIKSDGSTFVRTYERGVEDETKACGTGAVAVGLVEALRDKADENDVQGAKSREINMGRGHLTVEYNVTKESFTGIRLIGSAVHVFDGVYDITGLS